MDYADPMSDQIGEKSRDNGGDGDHADTGFITTNTLPSQSHFSLLTRATTGAVKRSIGSTIGFHNHGEGPYWGLLLVESAYWRFHI